MIGRRTPLRESMERSRRFLGISERLPEPSGLKPTLADAIAERARLRGEARTTARLGLIDDGPTPLERLSILSGEDNYADVVHERIAAMRENIRNSPIIESADPGEWRNPEVPAWVYGADAQADVHRDPLVPVWREVLEGSQSAYPAEPLGEAELGTTQLAAAPASVAAAGFWPPLMPRRAGMSLREWQAGPCNLMATQAANEVLDHPASRLNPLLVSGPSGSGKSHLLRAMGEGLSAGLLDRDIRLITAETFPGPDLPSGWDDLLMRCGALMIDDVDRIIARPGNADALGRVIAWAGDVGAQVLLTSTRPLAAESVPMGPLRQRLAASVHISMGMPSAETLVLMMRRFALTRGLNLTDEQLFEIARRARNEWGRARALFETVALAMEAGTALIGAAEVGILLDGGELADAEIEVELAESSADLGARIV